MLPLLAGCAAAPVAPHRPLPGEVSQFSIDGRLAVRRGEVRHHANLDWRHTPASDVILLSTPLGQGLAELVRDASGARLVLADGRTHTADDWNALAREVFGVALPLNGAARWLLGDLADTEGWRVEILERASGAPDGLPTLIELSRDDIVVRLKIDAWQEVK
ncbi:outer membrane lipoprotein LolB [Sulfuricystis multivorans]|uniref:outer membrane lipoprotein LolB n=1 Tax=Sulfuricystis multivorans TaxID=2211108 RepID=UPI00155954A8|nr:outer membrane lipoprotein LolB [Sulfuricystis multivorans]